MKECRPVEIPSAAFSFCKYSLALLFWAAWIMQIKPLVLFCFAILILSALLRVKNAPLVFLYTHSLNRVFPSKAVIVDENAVRFAHIVGAAFTGTALIFLYYINPFIGWAVTGLITLLKTSGALGFCGAMKLYECMNNPNGQCCRFGRHLKHSQCEAHSSEGGKTS